MTTPAFFCHNKRQKKYVCNGGLTAEQGLIASVCGGQWAQALQPLVQNSAQMACVAKAADGNAVQVHGLHKVAQQSPLQAQDIPSEKKMVTDL